MDHGHDHSNLCGDLCHLNERAKALYLDFIFEGRFDDAEALRRDGVIPPGMSLPVLA